jgi:hypothetical protein
MSTEKYNGEEMKGVPLVPVKDTSLPGGIQDVPIGP